MDKKPHGSSYDKIRRSAGQSLRAPSFIRLPNPCRRSFRSQTRLCVLRNL